MSDAQERVTCPACSKGYRWKSSLIGKRVPCKQCGSEFKVPIAPGEGQLVKAAPSKDVGYELDMDEEVHAPAAASAAAPANDGKCPSCNSPVRDSAVLCMNCGFNMAECKKVQTEVAATPASPEKAEDFENLTKKQKREIERSAAAHSEHWWIDYKAPLIVILVGLAMVLINNLALAPIAPVFTDFYDSTLSIIIDLTLATAYSALISSILLFAGLFILVWLFGSAFGALTSVLLKVIGITLVAQEADFMVIVLLDILMGTGGLGVYVSWAIYLAVMIGLCMKFLDVDLAEFRVLIVFIIIGRIATDMAIQLIFNGLI